MIVIEQKIQESYQDFISTYDHAPEYLYLGGHAYRAFCIWASRIATNKLRETSEDRYMGMKVLQVIDDNDHINCA